MVKQSTAISRRQFIRITASAGLLVAGGLGLGLAKGAEGIRVEETQLLMGSIAHMTLISSDPEGARRAIRAAFGAMSGLEGVFSRFQPDSQLSQLNANGRITRANPALHDVLEKAVYYGGLSSGAFDVTVEPVLRVYREAALAGRTPDSAAIDAARRRVDFRRIEITPREIRLNGEGMAITLDGIAKGYIIDVGTTVLAALGFDHVMVEVGGDLQTRRGANMNPWQIQIQRPRANSPQMYAQLDGRAIATSGDYQYTFTDDSRLHHIIDPNSGVSPDELASASAVALTACDADALSTAIMVMGAQAGLTLVDQLPDIEALVVTKQGIVRHSAQFPLG